MNSLAQKQPFKGAYVLLAVLYELTCYPFWAILYLFPSARPHPKWSYKQAISIRVAKQIAHHIVVVRMRTVLSLESGREGNRFVVINPYGQREVTYQGPAADSEIRPEPIGAVWHPAPLQKGHQEVELVLHFHGGAYVYGDARKEMYFPASQFIENSRATHVLMPAYRLSSNPGGRFPAALQDAITAYHYVIKTLEIPASRVTISGDSAGGNLALALVRYICEHGENLDLPWPGCVWLWSPWPDVCACLDLNYFVRQPNYRRDIVGPQFGYWGASAVSEKYDPRSPYLKPMGNAFKSKSPIWFAAGGAEVVYEDIKCFADEFKAVEGNVVSLFVQDHCVHDIIASGNHIGFQREAKEASEVSGHFLRANRYFA